MNEENRPDPQELLIRLHADEARARRGKLRIFFGASAGVGKTFAMLTAAHALRRQGTDVVVGIAETHGRTETGRLLEGLDVLPRQKLTYRDRQFEEFDIDAALARRPALILVDELAHSNVPGSRHPKRWQDIEELLSAGIDVFSTVNVQHLETLNDVVGGITGIRVWETVPDQVFDLATEVVLVDLPPDELLQRLKEGKVYLPHQAERAVGNFFRKGNLIALRELAMRRMADRIDSEVLAYRRDRAVDPVWRTRDCLLACIGPGEAGEGIVRATARLALRLDVPWHAIYVETPRLRHLSVPARESILRNLKVAQESGAQTASLAGADAAQAIIAYAREHNLSRVLVGRGRQRVPWRAGFAQRLGLLAADLDITELATSGPAARTGDATRVPLSERLQAPGLHYLKSLAASAVAAVLAMLLLPYFDLANIAMVFLLAVVLVATRLGLGPAVCASVVNVLAFDFFFVPPRFSFAVSDVQYLLTFAVMLLVGLLTAKLTSDLKHQAGVANRREQRMRALYEMARELSGALTTDQIAEIGARFSAASFAAHTALVLVEDDGRLASPIGADEVTARLDRGVCQWAFDHGKPAGNGTDTLPGSALLYLPLRAPMRMRGVLVIESGEQGRARLPEQQRLLETFGNLVAIAVERVHFVDVARSTTVQMESERLRNSLLSAISHDLRTPLAALCSLTESLKLTRPPLTPEQQELAEAMHEAILRIGSQVNNLLDMARLQAGAVTLRKEWQPLEEVVGSALRSLGQTLAGHRVAIDLASDLPLLDFDAVLIERVLANLLENAAKYTPAGSRITIAARRSNDLVRVAVEDDGPGLPVGRESAIFRKFERGDKEGQTPGVGLGLTIARAIVQAHGGDIRGENGSSGGARFEFTLPIGTPPSVAEDPPLSLPEASPHVPEPS